MNHPPESWKKIRTTWKVPFLLAALVLATVGCSEQRTEPPLSQAMPRPTVHIPAIDDDEDEDGNNVPDGQVVTVPFIVPARPMPRSPGLI